MSRSEDDRRWHRDNDAMQSRRDADTRRRRTQREAHQAIRVGQTTRALIKIVGAEGVLEHDRLTRGRQPSAASSAGTAASADIRACADRLLYAIACSQNLGLEIRRNWPAAIEDVLAASVSDLTRLMHIDAWILQLQGLIARADARPFDPWNVSVQAAFGAQREFDGLLRCLYALRAAVQGNMDRR